MSASFLSICFCSDSTTRPLSNRPAGQLRAPSPLGIPLYVCRLVLLSRQNIDICSGWQPRDGRVVTSSASGPPAPSPLTIVFGGNGAGKSAIFDAVFFVLGQVWKKPIFYVSLVFGVSAETKSKARLRRVFGDQELVPSTGKWRVTRGRRGKMSQSRVGQSDP